MIGVSLVLELYRKQHNNEDLVLETRSIKEQSNYPPRALADSK